MRSSFGLFLGRAGTVVVLLALAACAGTPAAKIEPPTKGGLTGRLLVAAPGVKDPTFARSVLLIVRDDEQGSMGLVINRSMARGPLAQVLKEVGLESDGARGEIDIHFGGPLGLESAFVVHSPDYAAKGTISVADGLALSTSPKILSDLALGAGPKRALFAIGYANWAPGELEMEISRRSWLVLPTDADLIFDRDFDSKWRRALLRTATEL